MAKDPSSGLDEHSRAFIVTQFAMYLTPQQVADKVKQEFGLSITRQQAQRYNPESVAGRELAAKWRKLHADVRERFHEMTTAVPMANRNARLRQLQEHYETALGRGNTGLCLQILEQIAKEVGNVHTNERRVTHDGKLSFDAEPASIEEKRNFVLDRVSEALEKIAGVKSTAPGTMTEQ